MSINTEAQPGQLQIAEFDATTNELPLLQHERIWGFWDYSSVNVGLAIATWAFLQGGAVALFVGAKAAIASIIIGYGISVLLVALVPCIPCARYGIEQFVALRSAFGANGARILMIGMSALLAAAWSAVLAIMFGHAMANVWNQLFATQISDSGIAVSFIGFIAVLMSWGALARGAVSVEWVNRIMAPALAVITVIMLFLIFTNVSWAELSAIGPLDPYGDHHLDFMLAIELNIAGGLAWWPNVGNLARLTRTSRSAFWPNMLGLFLASVVAAIVGVFAALALGSEDPTLWMVPLGGAVLGVIALGFVGLANISSIVGQGYSSMMALKGGGGRLLRGVPMALLAAILLIPAAVLVFFPATVYDNYSRFVSWGAVLLAPLCAVQFVDFFLLRRGHLSLRDLYLPVTASAYGYWRGFNPGALIAIVAGSVTYTLLLNPVSYVPSSAFEYLTASLPAFFVAGIVHYMLTRFIIIPMGKGGYDHRNLNAYL